MVTLAERYRPNQPPSDPEFLADFLRDELERIAQAMDARDQLVCGTVTFASAATAAVVFAREQPDTNYNVLLGGSVNENFWIGARAVTGFTIASSNAGGTSTADVGWLVVRDRDND